MADTSLTRYSGDTFPVRADVDPRYLQNALTKDITTLECVFDLVDNAIDSARNAMLRHTEIAVDRYGLPRSYKGYTVSVHFGSGWIAILDNGLGIDEDTLAHRTLRPGVESSHRFAIGRFGLGLKRALMKLGKKYFLSTDTGEQAYRLMFQRDQLGGGSSNNLFAQRFPTKRRSRTLVYIGELDSMVSHETSISSWKATAVKELSRRYGLFVHKGLCIFVNGQKVPPFGPGIRSGGPVIHQTDSESIDGINIFVDAGMHESYRISNEPDYDKKINGALTDQYGWYFVCNDRIVEVASHERQLGWAATWHQEYYGFVGWVRFVSEDVSANADLPWDTKKTSINPQSPAFLKIANSLQSFAELYKTQNKAARPDKKDNDQPPQDKPSSAQPPKPRSRPKSEPRPPRKEDHNENWTTLFPAISVAHDHDKLKALIVEAFSLDMRFPYAATMLLRAIAEIAIFLYIKRANRYSDVKKSIFDEQERDGRPFTEEQKKSYAPTLSNVVTWVLSNPDIFPDEYRRECLAAMKNFKKHLPFIQRVIHENALISSGRLSDIRNDCWPALKYILQNDPRKGNG